MSPTAILVAPTLGTGAPAGQVLDLATGLEDAGIPVIVLAESGRLAHEFRRRRVPVVLAPLPRHSLFDRRALRATRDAISDLARERPFIVHGHGAEAATAAALIARKTRAQLVLSLYDRADARATPPLGDHDLAAVLVPSQATQEELVNHRGVPRDLVRLVPPGIDLGRIGVEPERRPPSSVEEPAPEGLDADTPWGPGATPDASSSRVPVIGSLGRLEPLGGQEALLHAARELKGRDFRVLVCGEGPDKGRLLGLARTLEAQEITIFAGDLPGRGELYEQLAVFVAPGLRDGSVHDLIEAMARGLPVVATGSGTIFEIVEDGKTAILAPPQNGAALAQAIGRLLDDLPAARAMGERAREAALARFPVKRLVDEVVEVYERACTSRRTPS